ncbi:MAG: GntR family transcriptional regulator [Beijerinckiaceae bacterium]
MWRAGRATGSAEQVYRQLKAAILLLDVSPGQVLSEPELALRFGTSRTPVRESLIRLADEGLVEIVPKSGTRVSRIPLASLPEAILVRRALEETTTRLAAEKAKPSDLLRLEASVLRQEELAVREDVEAFHGADEEFHALISEIAGFPGIWTLVERAKMHIDRYRRLTLPEAGRRGRIIAEHRAVLSALRAGDPAAAAAAMGAHIAGLEISLDMVRSANPDFFVMNEP